MRRRKFITLLGGRRGVAGGRSSCAATAAKRRPSDFYLGATTPATAGQWIAAFAQRLRELGWTEGRTIAIEYRWAEGPQ